MVRGPLESVTAPKLQASACLQLVPPAGVNPFCRPGPNTLSGTEKMCRLNILKKEARKSMVAFSPKRRVFFPSVKSSFFPPNERASGRDRPSLPNVHVVPGVAQFAGDVKAAGFQNGVVAGLKFDLFVCGTPRTTLTRAPAPVVLHPPNKTSSAVPWQLS